MYNFNLHLYFYYYCYLNTFFCHFKIKQNDPIKCIYIYFFAIFSGVMFAYDNRVSELRLDPLQCCLPNANVAFKTNTSETTAPVLTATKLVLKTVNRLLGGSRCWLLAVSC